MAAESHCRIGSVDLCSAPAVVGVATRIDTLERLRAHRPPCDLVELRADYLEAPRAVIPLLSAPRQVPVILTIRHAREGGRWDGLETERMELYRAILPCVDAVDVEIDSEIIAPIAREAAERSICVIGSYHNFSETPGADLLRAKMAKGIELGARVVKVATWSARESDVETLEALLRGPAMCPIAAMGMGPLGVQSRLRLALAGSCLIYGFLDEPTAPGQLHAGEWVRRLRESLPEYWEQRA
ncbi:MAG: type I 3-dehydroquinate dehydratase [Kiritimatiellae bacterium]|nr:type I 3-dehydroquinate dehydratase [Kiritimatiellia bacterium]MDW8457831.1 type I 3-dehydroquinate dehydratase [Verrucomicrobiota bacterium]